MHVISMIHDHVFNIKARLDHRYETTEASPIFFIKSPPTLFFSSLRRSSEAERAFQKKKKLEAPPISKAKQSKT